MMEDMIPSSNKFHVNFQVKALSAFLSSCKTVNMIYLMQLFSSNKIHFILFMKHGAYHFKVQQRPAIGCWFRTT